MEVDEHFTFDQCGILLKSALKVAFMELFIIPELNNFIRR